MKKWAAFFLAAVLAFSAAAAYCESGISEIEKVLGVASFLLDSAIKKIEKEQKEAEEFAASMWMYNEANSAAPEDVPQIVDTLAELGIDGITAEHVGEMVGAAKDAATYGYVFSREMITLYLLTAVGMGTYDDNLTWHPSSETVLYLDMELFGGDTLYGDFFRGLNHICGGEFVFSDLREDYSDADMEEGEGTIGLSFLVNEERLSCSAVMMQDWFDPEVFNCVSEAAVHPESGKRLYAMYDGMQGLIIFYNTPEWAEQFEMKTGCPLSKEM